jgi:hypothetical protein
VLAAELDKKHPGAAASLREGMAETLTILHTWTCRRRSPVLCAAQIRSNR